MPIELENGLQQALLVASMFAIGTFVARCTVYLAIRMVAAPVGHYLRSMVMSSLDCDNCGKKLPIATWLPLLGWLATLRRCRHCRREIPWSHTSVELMLGSVSVLIPVAGNWSNESICMVFTSWLCFFVSWVDLKHRIIPQLGTWILLFTGLIWSPFEPDPLMRSNGAALSALCMLLSLSAVGLFRNRDTYAGGDVALAASAGAWIGLMNLPVYFLLSAFAFMAHAMAVRHIRGEVWVPMAPSLSCGLVATQILILATRHFQ